MRSKKTDYCVLCNSTFALVSLFGVGTKEIICKRCGKSVCEKCSVNERALAKKDPTTYKICDACDTAIDNFALRKAYDKLLRN